MTTTNTYADTKAVDYLEAIKRNQLESRNAKSSSSNFDITYMLPMTSSTALASTVSATAQTLGNYQIINSYDKLIAYIPFDYDVLDAMNNNDGTVTGTTTWTDGPQINGDGGMRKAFDFNGSSYVTLANESNFDFNYSNTFSISSWVKIPTITIATVSNVLLETNDALLLEINDNLLLETGVAITDHAIVSKIANITTPGYYLYVSTDGIAHFIIQNSTSDKIEVQTTTSLNTQYNHLLVTYSGSGTASGVKIYINGTSDTLTTISDSSGSVVSNLLLETNDALLLEINDNILLETTFATILNNTSLVIGALGDATKKITGQIDEVQIWNVELTSGNASDLTAGKQINKTSVTVPAVLGLSDVT